LEDLIRTHLPMECIEELIPVAKAHNEVVPKVRRAALRVSKKAVPKKEEKEEEEEEQPLERKSKRTRSVPKSKVTRKSTSQTAKKKPKTNV
jgi:hypothetical protein